MEKENFEKFVERSGLKKQFIATQIGVPNWVIGQWLGGRTILTKNQHQKLDKFIEDFMQSNTYMQEV